MDVSDDEGRDRTAQLLGEMGYRVTPIPERAKSGVKTCDLRATLREETLFVEVKRLNPRSSELDDLRINGAVTVSRKIGGAGGCSKFSEAAAQVRSTVEAEGPGLGLLSCIASDPGAIAHGHRAFCALYGACWVHIRAGQAGVGRCVPCLYIDQPCFLRIPDIAGALVEWHRGLRLWINPFAPSRKELRRTRLHRLLDRYSAVFDPERHPEVSGMHMAEPPDAERNRAAGLESLQRRHGIVGKIMSVDATSTGSPENEMGSYSPIAGAERSVGVLELRAVLARKVL